MDVSKVWLVFFLLALATVAESITIFNQASLDSGLAAHLGSDDEIAITTCSVSGQCDLSVEDVTAELLGSETTRRQLAGRKRYISYGALRANSVPCNRRGRSYYNCQGRRRANPYNRGCSVITHCHRFTG